MNFNPHNPTIKKLAMIAAMARAPFAFGQDLSEEECIVQAIVVLNSADGSSIADLRHKIQQHRNFSVTEIDTAVEDLVNADVLRRWRNARGDRFGFTLEFMQVIRNHVKENAHSKLEDHHVVKVNYVIGEKGLNLTGPEFRKLYKNAKNYLALMADGCIAAKDSEEGIWYKDVWFDFTELCVLVKKIEEQNLIEDKE